MHKSAVKQQKILGSKRPRRHPSILPKIFWDNSLSLFLFILFFQLTAPTVGFSKIMSVPVSEMAPDQMDAGDEEVERKVAQTIESLRALATTKGVPMENEVDEFLIRELTKSVTSYRSPDALTRPTDSHHRLRVVFRILKLFSKKPDQVDMRIDLKKDFTGRSWEEYVDWREKHDPIYIPSRIRETATKRDIVAYYQALPNSFDKMRNSPMRSAVGYFFDSIGLKGSYFSPFIQFHLGEKLEELGLEIVSGFEQSYDTQEAILKLMFHSEHSQRLQAYLLGEAKPNKHPEIRISLHIAESLLKPISPAPATIPPVQSKTVIVSEVIQTPGFAMRDTCYDRFAALKKAMTGVPGKISLPSEQTHLAVLLYSARTRSLNQLDPEELRNVLTKLQNGKNLTGPQQQYLDEARKAGLVLRAAMKWVADPHDRQEALTYRRFIRDFGELNDLIAEWNFKGKVPREVRNAARELNKSLDRSLHIPSIRAISHEHFIEAQRRNVQSIRSLLDRDTITIGEYHDLRKIVRDYRFLFELMAHDYPDAVNLQTARYLRNLSKKMGQVKDGLVIPAKRIEALPFLKRPTQIEPKTKEEILDFLNSLEMI